MEPSITTEQLLSSEYVYCMSNKSFHPNILKVGWTRYNPAFRANQLYTTGVPTPFVVEFLILTTHGRELEGRIHNYLSRHRVNWSREFFNISISELRCILENKFSLTLVQLPDIIDKLPKIEHTRKKKTAVSYLSTIKPTIVSEYDTTELYDTDLSARFDRFRCPSPPEDVPSIITKPLSLFDEFKYQPLSPNSESEHENCNNIFDRFRYNPL
jgi:hypothetical protein